jgi:DNA-binding transcriptional LysR family regulator
MDTEVIKCFYAVASNMSFTLASQQLFLTQSTLSRKIIRLEEELDTVLFDRSGGRLKLTLTGEIFYEKSWEIMKRLQELELEIKTLRGREGALRIGCYGIYDLEIVFGVSKVMKEKYPEIILNIYQENPGILAQDIKNGKTDVVFAVNCELEGIPDLQKQCLLHQKEKLIVNPEHRYASKKEVTMGDLADEMLVLWDRLEAPNCYDIVIRTCIDRGFVPRIHSFQGRKDGIILSILSSNSVTILPVGVTTLERENIKMVDIIDLDIDVNYMAAARNDSTNPVLPLFWSELLNVCNQIDIEQYNV